MVFVLLLCRTNFIRAYINPTAVNSSITRIMSSSSLHNIIVDENGNTIDYDYPGTAVVRMRNIIANVRKLSHEELSDDWERVRRRILQAGGLKDLSNAQPGKGYTGHSFNDYNHCDLTAMLSEVIHYNNEGKVVGIANNNRLGEGIKIASIEDHGVGGSWSTCLIGCNKNPPQDVAHLQFQSRIAFKLVWCPPLYKTFVLVDDDGTLLNYGTPTGHLPSMYDRTLNFKSVDGSSSKYGKEAIEIGKLESSK